MAITASQILTKFTTISTATTLATIGAYIPSASTVGQVYNFSITNTATSNKRAYVDVLANDGAGNSAYLAHSLPIDPGASKALTNVNKHGITASGYITGAIYATSAPCSFVMTLAEII